MNTHHTLTTETRTTAGANTAAICEAALQHGIAPAPGEPDNREVWDPNDALEALGEALRILAHGFLPDGFQLADRREAFLWGVVNAAHAQVTQIEREVDKLAPDIKDLQRSQDGSEVQAGNLESAIERARNLGDQRDAFEIAREHACAIYREETGKVWRPRTGSHTARTATLTAASLEARDYLRAREKADIQAHLPEGTLIALAPGSHAFDDANQVWDLLDKVRAKHPVMVLVHGGGKTGVDRAAQRWADTRKVPQVLFAPDFDRHGKAAPFRRNDRMIELLPAGVVAWPGTGITENFITQARQHGIGVLHVGT